jgi:rSAM/selenodomain-associated transferase 2
MISIIVPVYNEARILRQKYRYFQRIKRHGEVIFVDGGSVDETVALARDLGKVILAPKGRGIQKNQGAAAARFPSLLFLHVDTEIDDAGFRFIRHMLSRGDPAGCFRLKVDDPQPLFRVFEWAVNTRARLWGILDGDLGFFTTRDVFQRAGEFDPLPVMEDILFSRKIGKIVRVRVLSHPIVVSSRKWREEGAIRTFYRYLTAYLKFWTGRWPITSTKKNREPRNEPSSSLRENPV